MRKLSGKWLVVLTVIASLTAIADFAIKHKISFTIWSVIKWFVGLMVIKYTIPIWGIIILFLAWPILRITLAKLISKSNIPDWHSYTADTFYGATWCWRYDVDKINDLIPRCPECSCILKSQHYSGYDVIDHIMLKCDHCSFETKYEFNNQELHQRVEREIDRKIHNGEYKKL